MEEKKRRDDEAQRLDRHSSEDADRHEEESRPEPEGRRERGHRALTDRERTERWPVG